MIQVKNRINGLIIGIMVFFLAVTLLGISGCGDETGDETDSGDLVISLTDSEGDFARYKVAVTSLTLTKADNTVINTLPLSTDIDFAEYAEMTEFLTAATIPSGTYKKAKMTLNFANADIQVYNGEGIAEAVDKIQDIDGNEITTCEMSVHLENTGSLFITHGVPAHLTLDFDLNTSNSVNNSEGESILTVQPVLQAEVNINGSKQNRLRGPLKSVDINNNTFKVIIRPFMHILSGGDEKFGVLDVSVDDDTIYEINGTQYEGDNGLEALNAISAFTAIIAKGKLKINPQKFKFEAKEVYAGSSVPGGNLDVVTGNVVGRSGDELTVKGATLIRTDGSVIFNDSITIQVSDDTRVSRQLSTESYDIDDISIGQRIKVFGTLEDDNDSLDATTSDDHVNLLLTTLKGTVVDDDSSSWFVIDLNYIDGRRVDIFDFEGTGTDMANDADATSYEINSGSLNVPTDDTLVKVRGFVTGYGKAPADFEAQTIINLAQKKALMSVGWGLLGSTDAIEGEISENGFTLNLNNTGLFHHIGRCGIVKDLKDFTTSPSIAPQSGGNGLFSISQNGEVQVFISYTNFMEELKQRLEEGAAVKFLSSTGPFDDENVILTAQWIDIQLK